MCLNVYKCTNLINNQIYIGITNSFDRRILEHFRNAKNNEDKNKSKLYNAIRKYGSQNFKFEIIDECSDIEELKNKEIYYIELFDSKNKGMNSTFGGDGVWGHESSKKNKTFEEFYGLKRAKSIKRKIGMARKGKCFDEIFGKEKSKKLRKEISNRVFGSNNPFYKKTHSNETKKLMKEKRSAYMQSIFNSFMLNDFATFVNQYKNGISIRKLSEQYKISRQTLTKFLRESGHFIRQSRVYV